MCKPRGSHLFSGRAQAGLAFPPVLNDPQPTQPRPLVRSRPKGGVSCPQSVNVTAFVPRPQRRPDIDGEIVGQRVGLAVQVVHGQLSL